MSKEDNNIKEKFIYLDFNGKLASSMVKQNFFLKIVNLHKKNPLVQVNDLLFKGEYDYSMGTNLFFTTSQTTEFKKNSFEEPFDCQIHPFLCETKVLNLKPIRLSPKEVTKPQNDLEDIDFNLNWNYNILLEKLTNGSLKLEDMTISRSKTSVQDVESNIEEFDARIEKSVQVDQVERMEESMESRYMGDQKMSNYNNNMETLNETYNKLKRLSMRPVRRDIAEELIEEPEKQYIEAYEYHNIEKQILQTSDAFRVENMLNLDDITLSQYIDIDRCVLYGIIQPSTKNSRILTEEEKQKILTLENFDNLSLSARYCVIEKHIENLEKYLTEVNEEEINAVDEFGRTPMKTLDLFKKMRNALKKRLEEIKFSLEDEKNYFSQDIA